MFNFESLSIYSLYDKRLVEMIYYSEILKPNIPLRKLQQRKKKRKKKGVWVKHQCRNGRWWRDMWSSQSSFELQKKNKQGHPII